MGVIENGDAIRRDIDDPVNRVCERINRLIRQPIDQVKIHALKAQLAGPLDRLARDLLRLDSVDRFLDLEVKILNTKARAVKSNLVKSFHVLASQSAWIDLYTCFDGIIEIKALADKTSDVLDLVRFKIRRGSAAPVHLYDLSVPRHQGM